MAGINLAANGNVIGPVSGTDNAITRFDGTSGKVVQVSLATISDVGTGTFQGGLIVNPTNADIDSSFAGDTMNNVLLVDAGNDGVVLGGTKSTFIRDGATIKSAFLAVKPDQANWNAGAQIIYTSQALRTVDFSLLKARGTEASPTTVVSGDDISNFRWEGHDGTDFIVSSLVRAAVDGTVATNIVPGALYISTADTAGTLTERISIRASGNIGINRTNPLSGLDVVTSLGLKRTATATDYRTAGDIVVAVTNTSAARTITLSTADTVGRRTIFVNDESGGAGTNHITVATEGSQKIDGQDTFVIDRDYGAVTVYCDGTNWFTLVRDVSSNKTKITNLGASTYTMTQANDALAVQYTTTGTVTVTLPAASASFDSTINRGRRFLIFDAGCNASVNNITVQRAGSDTIVTTTTGNTSTVINSDGGTIDILAISATTWKVL
jgi:hypothetical protein